MTTATTVAPQSTTKPPEATHQFDFWVGKWKCSGESYAADGKPTHTEGSNTIQRILGGHVVLENFKMKGLNGTSASVIDR